MLIYDSHDPAIVDEIATQAYAVEDGEVSPVEVRED